jgi:hypothetical protein
VLAFNLKSLNNNASALIEARGQSASAGVRSALENVQDLLCRITTWTRNAVRLGANTASLTLGRSRPKNSNQFIFRSQFEDVPIDVCN